MCFFEDDPIAGELEIGEKSGYKLWIKVITLRVKMSVIAKTGTPLNVSEKFFKKRVSR